MRFGTTWGRRQPGGWASTGMKLTLCVAAAFGLLYGSAEAQGGQCDSAAPPPSLPCEAGACPAALAKPIFHQDMEYRRLGRSGLWVSVFSYGAWVTFGEQLGDDQALAIMSAAVAKGINFFDNAEVYADGKAELMMGRVVKRAAWDRRQLVISTKIFQTTKSRGALGPGPNDYGLSRKHVVEGLRASLQRLQMDYVDIVFAHRYDRHTPMEEVVRAFNHVIDKGWALYWGTSEWSADQIWEAHHVADRLHLVGPTAEQPQYNMLWRQRFEVEYASLFEQKGMGSTIWSPLASGLLTGKYAVGQAAPQGSRLADARFKRLENRTGPVDRQLVKVRALEGVAKELGCSMPQLAIAWTLSNAHVSTVLLGGTKVRHIEENIASLKVVSKLTGEVLARIDQAMGGAEDDQAALRVAVGTDWTGRDGMSNMQTRT